MRVLVVNVGSSTLKLSLVHGGSERLASRDIAVSGEADLATTVEENVRAWGVPDAVGHRIVHGGTAFHDATLLDGTTISALAELAALAPLHQDRGLAGVAATRGLLPDTPQVACFDTAFFAGLPVGSRTYALPKEWRQRFGLQRFGFHGLSHSYAVRRAATLLGPEVTRRIVTCHLGSGASLAGIVDGKPLDTTMGFTPLEGVVMSTRSGSIDPGILLWLQSDGGLDVTEVADGLEHRAGLLGLAGTTDMREVLGRAASGDEEGMAALAVYIHRLRAGIGAMAAATDGLDVLLFTGGVGENSPEVRARACAGLRHLGIRIDEAANASAVPDAHVGAQDARVAVMTIAAGEDLEIATQADRLLTS